MDEIEKKKKRRGAEHLTSVYTHSKSTAFTVSSLSFPAFQVAMGTTALPDTV